MRARLCDASSGGSVLPCHVGLLFSSVLPSMCQHSRLHCPQDHDGRSRVGSKHRRAAFVQVVKIAEIIGLNRAELRGCQTLVKSGRSDT